jgi:hypothetical protein
MTPLPAPQLRSVQYAVGCRETYVSTLLDVFGPVAADANRSASSRVILEMILQLPKPVEDDSTGLRR